MTDIHSSRPALSAVLEVTRSLPIGTPGFFSSLRKCIHAVIEMPRHPPRPQRPWLPERRNAHLCSSTYARERFRAYSIADVARLIDVTENEVRQQLAAGSLYGANIDGELLLPDWQFDLHGSGQRIKGLSEIIEAAADLPWYELSAYMHNPQSTLQTEKDANLIEWLHLGQAIDVALTCARDSHES